MWIQGGAKARRKESEVEGWKTEHNKKKERGEVEYARRTGKEDDCVRY